MTILLTALVVLAIPCLALSALLVFIERREDRRQLTRDRQIALVAKLWRDEPHRGVAYERFTPEGPMALLPEGDHYGLVWTTTPAHGRTLAAMPDSEFLAALATRTAG